MIIPFFIPHSGCPHQCVFCNQKHITGKESQPTPDFIQETIHNYLSNKSLDSRFRLSADRGTTVQVAFYGGSFTALPLKKQKAYLNAAGPFIRSGRVQSIRLSTRPDCISTEVLELLKENHVETVELGAQSMNNAVLTLSGRGHTASDTINAVTMLREYRFSIGLQLMPGLPGDSAHIFSDTVDRTIALKPDFVRLYPALVIKDTPLEQLYNSGHYSPLSLDEAIAICKNALLIFEDTRIDVIRIGLQPTEELEKEGVIIAGPYHPAFRQLVESSILRDRMEKALTDNNSILLKVKLFVNPKDLSNAIGQKRSNINALKKQFGLKQVDIQPDSSIPRKTVKLDVS